ncbi:type IV secretory system conjugative DNA transfer family protein [Nocardia niigatensis]
MDRSVKAPGQEMDPETRQMYAMAGLAVGIPTLTEVAGISVWLAPVFGGPKQDVPLRNPVGLGWHLFAEQSLQWPVEAWAGLGTVVLATVAGVTATAYGVRWACERCTELRERGRERRAGARQDRANAATQKKHAIDAQARYLARGQELDGLSARAMTAKAAELKVRMPEAGGAPGVSIGEPIGGRGMLYASYEDLHVDIWGPRQGKSTSRVIPAVMEAIGPVLTTSNKRDVVDATRDHRNTVGTVKVFDPQQVANEACTWYWDPLAWVMGPEGGSGAQERAIELAGHFAAGGDADKRDAFFDPEGESLLAGLILAAAVSKRPITQVFKWITSPREFEPIKTVKAAGFEMVASALADQYNAPDRQRAGIFSTAKKMAACLALASITEWVVPADGREGFDVEAFVGSTGTLYLLSADKKSNAGPLVTAFAAAVADAGTREGERNGGRLPVPLLLVLDEAANIVKWAELPKQYSHFGSRGMVVMTVLQSWAQGVRCWGPEGMQALWGAANIRVLGSGLSDTGQLRDVAELVGNHYELVSSTSTTKGVTSRSTSRVTEPTLTVSDLAKLPRGRALLLASGYGPALIATVPWQQRPYAQAVRDSIHAHDPAFFDPTITEPPSPAGGRAVLRVVPTEPDEQEKSA